MDAQELRNFNEDELKSRVRQWQDELFRAKFKAQSSETKDTSILKKLRKDIARGLTILNEKTNGIVRVAAVKAAPSDKPAAAPAKKKKASAKATKAGE